jgi:cytochrome c oxidase subunit 3
MAVLDAELRAPGRPRPVDATDHDWGVPPPPPPDPGGNGDGGPPSGPDRLPLANARLAMLTLIGAEGMFFGGLVIAFLNLRLDAAVWPPPGQPRLPIGLTALNTLVLLSSSATFVRALRAVRAGDRAGLLRWLGWTWGLGILFLVIQGVEWTRLVGFGLRVSSGVYGATFYTLIGIHGAHVLGAVVWLGVVLLGARAGRFTARRHIGVVCCAMYWHFVVALWPLLYLLVYLA